MAAESQNHLNIPYTGDWNETPFDAQYVKTLRSVLDKERPGTKIVCCDEYPHEGLGQWNILDAMRKDPALAKAVDIISVHYPREKGKLTTPADATSLGKPLWSSEDQPESSASHILSRDWAIGGRSLAHLYNENYLQGHFTKTEIWSPVTSYYDILAAPNSGLMYANTPWSGHYDVQGAIWATAHTTQFADPGWRYLDNASGQLSSGSYVTLAAPNGHDWSMVVETIHSKQPTSMKVTIEGSLGQRPAAHLGDQPAAHIRARRRHHAAQRQLHLHLRSGLALHHHHHHRSAQGHSRTAARQALSPSPTASPSRRRRLLRSPCLSVGSGRRLRGPSLRGPPRPLPRAGHHAETDPVGSAS